MLSNDTPKVDNIAMAISGGKTLDIVKACDIFYGNQESSTTIVEAIEKGIKAGSLTLGMGTEDEVTVTASQLKALIALLNA